MTSIVGNQKDLNFKATELRLGLPGTEDQESDQEISNSKNNNKRALPESTHDEEDCESKSSSDHVKTPPVAK